MTETTVYAAELTAGDDQTYATDTRWVGTAAEAHADALALASCKTLGEAVATGLTFGPDDFGDVHPDALLRGFRVVRHLLRDGQWVAQDDTYEGPQGTYKAALALVGP
jgi:hypothetical protein